MTYLGNKTSYFSLLLKIGWFDTKCVLKMLRVDVTYLDVKTREESSNSDLFEIY